MIQTHLRRDGWSIAVIALLGILLHPCYADEDLETQPLSGMDVGNRRITFEHTIQRSKPDLSDWDYVGRWGSASDVAVKIGSTGEQVLEFRADGKTNRVGKAYVTKEFPAVTRGQIVEAQATYITLDQPTDGALYLMDFECRHCGHAKKAGIRVLLRNGRLSVNRSKLGMRQDFFSEAADRISAGEPFTLTVRLLLGAEDGETTVLVNGQAVVKASGINMPLQEIAKQFGVSLEQEQFDYVQFGITANSSSKKARLLVSNVAIQVFR